MSHLPLPPGLPSSGSGYTAVLLSLLAVVGALITGAFAWSAARFTATAPQQMAMNDAFRSLTEELQTERARLIAQISELEKDVKDHELEVLRLRGEIRGRDQLVASLIRLCERSKIKVPPQYRLK